MVDKVLNHFPELKLQPKGKFQQILVTQDTTVFFFAYEKSEMKPASHARRGEFALVVKSEHKVFPKGNVSPLNISSHVTVFHVGVSEAASALDLTCKGMSANMATALSGGVPCSDEFLKNIKILVDKTGESVTQLRGTLCDIAIPEILTTACLCLS